MDFGSDYVLRITYAKVSNTGVQLTSYVRCYRSAWHPDAPWRRVAVVFSPRSRPRRPIVSCQLQTDRLYEK